MKRLVMSNSGQLAAAPTDAYVLTQADIEGANSGQRPDLIGDKETIYEREDGALFQSTGQALVRAERGLASIANTVVYLGDSRFARGSGPSPGNYGSMVLPLPTSTVFPTVTRWEDRGLVHWMQACTQQKLYLLRNAGVPGNRTQHMLARLQADVLSLRPGCVVVLAGYNNIVNGDALTTITDDLSAIYSQILGSGAHLVAITELPTTGIFADPAQLAVWNGLNSWMRRYCHATPRATCVDAAHALSDPTTGDPLAGVYSDGIHPVMRGSQLVGAAFARANPFAAFTASQLLVGSNRDILSAANPGGSIVLNPLMTGTTGTNSGAGMSGSVATSWTHQLEYGTATSVASKVPRTDGRPGEYQQVAATGVTGAVRLQQTRSVATAGYSIGATLRCLAEVAVDNATACDSILFMATAQNSGYTDIASWAWNMNSTPSTVGPTSGTVLAQIPDFVVPVGTNHITFKVLAAGTAGSITLRVGTVDIRQVL